MSTYSFLDVSAVLSGLTGSVEMGAGASNSEEGITIEAVEDSNVMTIGADGKGFHARIANNAAHVTVKLLHTSPVNGILMGMYEAQKASSQLHGKNTIAVLDTNRYDVVTLTEVAFKKRPTLTFNKAGEMKEWTFDAIKTHASLSLI